MASREVKELIRRMKKKEEINEIHPEQRTSLTGSAKDKKKEEYVSSVVHLTNQHQRWMALQARLFVGDRRHLLQRRYKSKADTELARILMDSYEQTNLQETKSKEYQAEAGCAHWNVEYSTPLSAAMSGVKPFREDDTITASEDPLLPEKMNVTSSSTDKQAVGVSKKRRIESEQTFTGGHSSFINPFNVSITMELNEVDCDPSQPYFDPEEEEVDSADCNYGLTCDIDEEYARHAEEVSIEEVLYGQQEDEEEGPEQMACVQQPGVPHIKRVEQCQGVCSSTMCLAFLDQIKLLARVSVPQCKEDGCDRFPTVQERFTGSALYLTWECDKGHVSYTWCSQPLMPNGTHCGDFLISAVTLFSGSNYTKLRLWANMLNLPFPGKTFFHAVQKHYLVDVVKTTWQEHQAAVFQSLAGKDMVVLGDARKDSPGHSANYCSYSLMDMETTKIVAVHCMDKRQTQGNSTNMERAAFAAALDEADIKARGVRAIIKEVVTDAHIGIAADMKSRFREKKHSLDVWHMVKNIGKKLGKICAGSQGVKLRKWVPHILNHFWWCCHQADSPKTFVGHWRGVLHHVCNSHVWDHMDTGISCCSHGDLNNEDRDKPWLHRKADAALLKQLATVILDRRLLLKAKFVITNRSTANLEVYHQHILMYASKRFAYTPPVYEARNLLAALDHNHHADRALATTMDGRVQYNRCFNKKSGRWLVAPVKVRKDYPHIPGLKLRALQKRLSDPLPLHRKELDKNDPRRISAHLVPVFPPPTSQLVAQKRTRFL